MLKRTGTLYAPVAPDKPKKKLGRPVLNFVVALVPAGGTIALRPRSFRTEVINYLRECGGRTTIADLEAQFGRQVRGAVQKLIEVNWVGRPDH